MAFNKSTRQRIIDGYLSTSGRNMFVPSEFLDWLEERPDHEMYPLFFGKTDAEAARAWRLQQVRIMVSGLRIVATYETVNNTVVSITTREYPAFVSPVAGRRTGGGYEPTDPANDDQLAEFRRQGESALRGWLARYRGVFELAGVDLSPIEAIAQMQDVAATA